MIAAPSLTLHVLPLSHPCMTARAALDLKGLDYEEVTLTAGPHAEEIQRVYGEGRTTAPGLLVDGEPVHGSRPVLARLEKLVPSPALYPEAIADRVREAERWGDEEFQDYGRRLPFGALHFRPEAMGTFGGAGTLDPAGTDFAMKYLRGNWKYLGITAQRLAADLASLPAGVEKVHELIAEGLIGGDEPTAADLQIGATLRVLLTIRDLDPLLAGTPAEALARRLFPDYPGNVPAGAFPASWLPA